MASLTPSAGQSRLLDLPAELRCCIFTSVLAGTACRGAIDVWDDVCTSGSGKSLPIQTAILQACRTSYHDSVPILYDNTTLETTMKGDIQDDSFPRFQLYFGPLENCSWLRCIRRLELEVSYKRLPLYTFDNVSLETERETITSVLSAKGGIRFGYGPACLACDNHILTSRVVDTCQWPADILRVSERIRNFARACPDLKTIDLTFYDNTARTCRRAGSLGGAADPILEACQALGSEDVTFTSISRNSLAKRTMSPEKWSELTSRCGTRDKGEEKFHELSFD